MNLQPHIDTLRAVLAGRHPDTGQDIAGNALDDGAILRRLMRAMQDLEALQLEQQIQSSTRRKRAPWADVEDEQLKNEFNLHGTECFDRLAVALERTPRSVAERAQLLGLIKSRAQVVTKEDRTNSLFASKVGAGVSQ